MVFGDPLLVKQGRNVVITPRGEELREQIRPLLRQIDALFVPDSFEPAKLQQQFVIRAGEAVLAGGGSQILAQSAAEAPNVHIRFENEATDGSSAVRSISCWRSTILSEKSQRSFRRLQQHWLWQLRAIWWLSCPADSETSSLSMPL